MKASVKQYAKSLYEMVKGKSEKESKEIVKQFFNILVKDSMLSKTDKIIIEFSEVWNQAYGAVEATVVSARELDKASRKSIIDYVKKISKAKDVYLNESVNKDILGGVVVKYGDKIIDCSLRGRVESLGKSMEK